MLIAQGPLRISLFGGGSDLPAYLAHANGSVLSFAIDRRVYVVGHPFTHRTGILLKYSQTEDVGHASELRHPIAREVLTRYDVRDMDIAVMSDVPAGTGMGSSSSFTVAFLAFVRHSCGLTTTPEDLAREACEIEIDVLKEPIGYQDQWASALGGINRLDFTSDSVTAEPIPITPETVRALEGNLHLVPIGTPRSANDLLARQSGDLAPGSKAMEITSRMVDLVQRGQDAILRSVDDLGPLLDEAWRLKRDVAHGVTTDEVDEIYSLGIRSGATGGKLLGAGGSGYLAFYVPQDNHERFARALPRRLDFRLSADGAGVVYGS